jgi:murein DD-endopeptidase MepM/ murein hydrolase activator NlpD
MTELPQATSRRQLREQEAAAAAAAADAAASHPKSSRAPRPRKASRPRRSIARHALSFAAMVFVGALAIGLSIPANLFVTDSSAAADVAGAPAAKQSGQTVTVADPGSVDAGTRDRFQVLSWAQVLAQKYAQVNNYSFSGGQGTVRWPFPYQVPISSPYGPRIAPCGGCSTMHNGVDFTPGEGAAIFAIADGVVSVREDGTSEYGNFVIITHKIGKDSVTSTYAHMLAGSSAITLGQTIHVGDFLGLVGMTGEATGPHLHFEIAVNGARTDPIPWLESHVN